MESTYAPTLDGARWRTATIVATALAIVELVALVAIGVAFLGKSVAHHVQTAALERAAPVPKPRPARAGGPKLARDETDVLVLNGGTVAGAAGAEADRLRARGYIVGSVGNAPQQAAGTHTLVMYRNGFAPEAKRLAHDVGTTLVTPLDGMSPSQLLGAHVVLVVGG